jgi:hypothetical protein
VHVLGRADLKKAHALGKREDVEQVAPQAVEVNEHLFRMDDWNLNTPAAIDKAHVLCKTNMVS